jgi:hypothetical protein
MKLSLGKKITGLAVAGVLVVGAATVAWASGNGGAAAGIGGSAPAAPSTAAPAASSTAAPATSTKATGKAAGKAAGKASGKAAGKASGNAAGKAAGTGLALLRRADHGDVEVQVKGATGAATWKTVTFDRGQVTDVAADHITLARPDGKSVTLSINADTKYRGVTSWQTVAKSKGAIVVSESGKATIIIQRTTPAPSAGPAPAA